MPKEQGDGEATVIAWIWARTAKCPNPACGCEMPLASNFILSKKKGYEYYIEPFYENEELKFSVHKGKPSAEKESNKRGRSASFACPKCGEVTSPEYIKHIANTVHLGSKLMAVVAEGNRGRCCCAV